MKKNFFSLALIAVVLLGLSIPGHAQWITQSFELKAGWNAVYLHVDATYATLQELIVPDSSNPIQEVWLWNPAPSTLQFIDSPQAPTGGGSQWTSWQRAVDGSKTLQRLIGNAAYLVRVSSNAVTYTWNLQGKPLPPRYEWTTTGLNFLGFPTLPANPPSFENFLSKEPELQRTAEIFRYVGGDLGADNPVRVFAMRTTPVRRGEAYWIRSGDTFNRYFGPFELLLQNSDGVHFRDLMGQYRVRLHNLIAEPLIVSVQLVNSETPPAGQRTLAGAPPLLLRGSLNPTNLTYSHTNLVGMQSWTLARQGQPGSEVEVVLGLSRSQMSGNAGDLYAGVLRFTDSLNFSRLDIPVSAEVTSRAGLWVGDASVTQVRHYLKNYQKDATGGLVVASNGQYVATATNTSLGSVARSFPLRLIVHSDTNGNAVLLQRVYYGRRAGTNTVLATQESLLDQDRLDSARRISVPHLPFSAANTSWNFFGELRQGTSVTATVALPYDDQPSSPFLHTYHPDHDNLNATFDQKQPQGFESYSVSRDIKLTLRLPADDFLSLTTSGQTFVGDYDETVTFNGRGGESRQFDVRGNFILNRISEIPQLTRP